VGAASRRPLVSIAYPGLVAGVFLFTALVVRQGIHEVASAVAVAGSGLLVVAFFHVVPMLADALGWRVLVGPGGPGIVAILFARWTGESVNGLLPVMQVGGNVVKARFLVRRGVPADAAAASVVVDVTLVMLTQIGFTLLGLTLLVARLGGARIALVAVAGAAIMASLAAGFGVAQRRGVFGLVARVGGRFLRGADPGALSVEAAAIDARVARLWGERGLVARAAGWHLASWLVGAGEIWLALRYLGHPVDVRTAVLVESLAQAVRAGAFAVPGALGVQEGGFLVLASALGLGPDTGLALSLTRRVREVVLGLPGLVAWQIEAATSRVRAVEASGGRVIT
jgi:putative membrane protein